MKGEHIIVKFYTVSLVIRLITNKRLGFLQETGQVDTHLCLVLVKQEVERVLVKAPDRVIRKVAVIYILYYILI